MRAIPPALQAKLDSGVTTLCRCWRLARRDGMVLGFTDHDSDVTLGTLTCHAASGLTASEATSKLGLAVDGSEIAGALSDDALSDDDLAAGRYDGATIEVHLVDWSEPALSMLLSRGSLGEVRREGKAFAAEIRGLADKLNEETGRRYAAACSADLGDARCTVNLTLAAYRATGAVTAVFSASVLEVSGLGSKPEGWFSAGRLLWADGANAGVAVEVKSHTVREGIHTLELWQAQASSVEPGDTFSVTAGCDKRFETCRERFANAISFRGFPHIPGNDFVTRYAIDGEAGHDGRALVE